jgi:undecaprenyl-diphosphatase
MIRINKFAAKQLQHIYALKQPGRLRRLLAVVIAGFVLALVISEIFLKKSNVIDQRIFDYLDFRVNDRNTKIMQLFTFLGSLQFLLPAYLSCLLFLVIKGKRWYALKVFLVSTGNLLLMFGLKYFFHRQRPAFPLLSEVPGLSFPSGHAFMALAFFSLFIQFVYLHINPRWLKYLLIVMLVFVILMVGFSRVYLRLHYASDVLAGFCFGFLSVLLMMWVMEKVIGDK